MGVQEDAVLDDFDYRIASAKSTIEHAKKVLEEREKEKHRAYELFTEQIRVKDLSLEDIKILQNVLVKRIAYITSSGDNE